MQLENGAILLAWCFLGVFCNSPVEVQLETSWSLTSPWDASYSFRYVPGVKTQNHDSVVLSVHILTSVSIASHSDLCLTLAVCLCLPICLNLIMGSKEPCRLLLGPPFFPYVSITFMATKHSYGEN